MTLTLAELPPSRQALITALHLPASEEQRLLELGFTPHTEVVVLLSSSHTRGVCVCHIRGTVFTLSNTLARHVLVQPIA